MNNWTDMILDDVATIEIGGTPSREISAYWASTFDSGFPWVSIADLQKRVITETKERITEKGISHSNVKPISEGTLIISFKLSIGRAALAGTALFTNEAIAAIRPKDKRIHAELLYYVLPSVAKNAITDTAVKGATLNKSSLGKLTFRVPIKYEQQGKIAKILQTIDRTITHTEALIEKYQQIKAGLMHDLFTRGIGADGKLRPPRDQAPEMYRESSIGWIPKEWDCVALSQVADLVVGFAFKSDWFQDNGISLLRGENVGYGHPDWKDKRCLSYDKARHYKDFLLGEGDVVIGMDRTFTKSGVKITVLRDFDCPCLLVQRVGRFVAMSCHNLYLRWILLSSKYLRDLVNQQKGMDIPHLSKSEILAPLIPLPPLEEQVKIAKRIEICNSNIQEEYEHLEKLKKQKSGLMHDLITGKVQVNSEEIA
jgi:type I restriction enzyme, S subunit